MNGNCGMLRPGMLLVILAAVMVAPSRADIVDEIAERYARDGGVDGRFEQRLTSPGGRERVYTGQYHYSRTAGLTWEVWAPNPGRLTIDKSGDTRISGELGGLSMFQKRTVGRLVVAMVSLDESVLERYYTIVYSTQPDGFEITLEALPRWRRLAGTVKLRGTRLVDTVHMELADGRTMTLSLTHEE